MKNLLLIPFLFACAGATEEQCSVTLNPVPELAEYTIHAAERWSTATGCAVTVGEGGTPVVLVPNPTLADGTPKRAVYDAEEDVIKYRSGDIVSWTAETILAHEIGHLLGCHRHTNKGLLIEKPALRQPIEYEDLECVCESLACRIMQPEA